MLSSALNSDRAIAVNIEIMRSFVRIRRMLEADKFLARKFDRLERKLASHDQAIVGILSAIRQLINPPEPKRRGIGFTADFQHGGNAVVGALSIAARHVFSPQAAQLEQFDRRLAHYIGPVAKHLVRRAAAAARRFRRFDAHAGCRDRLGAGSPRIHQFLSTVSIVGDLSGSAAVPSRRQRDAAYLTGYPPSRIRICSSCLR
jgi:hypothetical protein